MMQIVTAGPLDRWNIIMQGFMRAIAQSRRYVYIQSPYFIPTEPVLRALQNAALGGVDVRIMIPYRGDRGVIPALASRSYVKEALEAGINIYFYQKGYMHAKTMVCDDNFVTIGSTNFDFRSFEQDFEINAFMYDPSLAVEYRNIFIQDQEACDKPELDSWLSRPLWERFKESFARIFSPLL
jgi:cardiolipin synthase